MVNYQLAVAVALCLLAVYSVPVQSVQTPTGSKPDKLVSLRLTEFGDQSWISLATALNLTSDDLEQSFKTIYQNGSRTVTLMKATLPTPNEHPITDERTNTEEPRPLEHLTNLRAQDTRQWKRRIFGKDDRKKLPSGTKAQQTPHAAACQVSCGILCNWSCSGTLIGSRHVLTSAHCVEGKAVSSIRVGFLQIYGRPHWFNVVRVDLPLGRSVASTRVADDYALLRLDRESNRTPLSISSSPKIFRGTAISFSAYHGDKGRNSLWLSRCKVAWVTNDVIGNKCDAARGSSGAGILMSAKKGIHSYEVVGVLSGVLTRRVSGSPRIFNVAVRMNRKRATQIRRWISAP